MSVTPSPSTSASAAPPSARKPLLDHSSDPVAPSRTTSEPEEKLVPLNAITTTSGSSFSSMRPSPLSSVRLPMTGAVNELWMALLLLSPDQCHSWTTSHGSVGGLQSTPTQSSSRGTSLARLVCTSQSSGSGGSQVAPESTGSWVSHPGGKGTESRSWGLATSLSTLISYSVHARPSDRARARFMRTPRRSPETLPVVRGSVRPHRRPGERQDGDSSWGRSKSHATTAQGRARWPRSLLEGPGSTVTPY